MLIVPQWSNQGQDVHLIDAQPSQLQASIGAVEELRASWSAEGSATGKIVTHPTDELIQALQTSWLVIEVCSPAPDQQLLVGWLTPVVVCAGAVAAEEADPPRAGFHGTRGRHSGFKFEQLLVWKNHQRLGSEAQKPDTECTYLYVSLRDGCVESLD